MAHSVRDSTGAVRDSIGPAIQVTKDSNGIDQVLLSTPKGATAQISLLGAEVTSWCQNEGEELLFKSSKTSSKVPKRERGGISICFPQFENRGSLHGFVRNTMWSIDENPPPRPSSSSGSSPEPEYFVDLLLKSSEELAKFWPHSFEFRLRVSLATNGDLTLISQVRNTKEKTFSFSFSYHTYLLVSDISGVRIEGLETLDYLDNLSNKERRTEQGDALSFESEVDRVYLHSTEEIAVVDHNKRKTYVIRKEGLPDVAVWNPWEKKLVDFGKHEYKQMVCVDGAVLEDPVKLKPGEEWIGKIKFTTKYEKEDTINKVNWKCLICKVDVGCENNMENHYRGKKHRTKMADELKSNKLDHCHVCNIKVPHRLMKSHELASWHMKNLKKLQLGD